MRRRRSSVDSGGVDDDGLEPLDPTTGLAITGRNESGDGAGFGADDKRARIRRLRRTCRVLLALALTSLVLAAYAGYSIDRVRRVERVWRTALAVDDVRARTDRLILSTLDQYGGDDSVDSYLAAIGSAETSELASAETSLRNQRIIDGPLGAVRQQMITALQFRQRQMSPQRRQLGDTPIRQAETGLARQLRRWRLRPRPVTPPVMAEDRQVRERLRRYADETTGTTLVALRGDELVTIDVDGSTVQHRPLPAVVDTILAIEPNVVATVGPFGVRAYDIGAPSSSPPLWERPLATAFAAAGSSVIWLREGTKVTRLAGDGSVVGGPFALSGGFEPVAAIKEGLVLMPAVRSGSDEVTLWRPDTNQRTLLASGVSRFIAAGRDLVVVEHRFVVESDDRQSRHDQYRTDVVSETGELIETIELAVPILAAAERPHHLEIAATRGPLAIPTGAVARYTLPGVVAVPFSRASTRYIGPLAWAPSGEFLFWLTADGSIAIHQPVRRRQQTLRVPLRGFGALVTLPTPQ